MTFSEQWAALESEPGDHSEVRRRIYPDSPSDMWLVFYRPTRVRALRVAVGGSLEGFADLPVGQGIDVTLNPCGDGTHLLEVALASRNFEDLFDAFVADIAGAAAGAPNANEVPKVVSARVRRWQAFLREHVEGLSSERQRGLFGELHILRTVIASIGAPTAVAGWVGPAGTPQDFSIGLVAIEIKTSAGKNPQKVRVSSERQLDDSVVDHLYLWHLSVDERVGVGETLPELVAILRGLADENTSLLFEEKLLAAGYHDVHADRYPTGYSLRSSIVFAVGGEFPRLTEEDCPAGLGDVQYSLELGALAPFEVERNSLLENLQPVTDND